MDKKNYVTLITGIVIGIVIGYLLGVVTSKESNLPPAAHEQTGKPNDLTQFIEAKKQELEKNPDDVQTRIDLSNLLFDSGDYSHAVTHYMEVLEVQPDNTNVLSDLGVCYRRTGQFDKALEKFRRVTELEPEHVIAWYNIAVTYYYDQKNISEARKALDKVLKIDPFYKNALRLKAEIEKIEAQGK